MSQLKTIKQWAASEARKNNTKKGDSFEDQVEAFLLGRGWVVERARMNRRMIRRGGRCAWITIKADFFGCFDFIAVHPNKAKTIFVQATTSLGDVSRKKKEIDETIPSLGFTQSVEVWVPGVALGDFKVHVRALKGQWHPAESALDLYPLGLAK